MFFVQFVWAAEWAAENEKTVCGAVKLLFASSSVTTTDIVSIF
jgi:hypothetical protein